MKQTYLIFVRLSLALLLTVVLVGSYPAQPAQAASEYYVSPNGSSSNAGTKDSPWNLQTAFAGGTSSKKIAPGDTIWLLGGKYGSGESTVFSTSIAGTATAPIKIRQYPGQRAVIDGGIDARGQYVWFWGFEITNSSTDRYTTESQRPIGLKMWAPNQKSINVSVHNTGRTSTSFHYRGEQYGGIYFGNGFYDTSQSDKIRGGSVYANLNESTPAETNLIANTISFRNWNSGIKVYSEWTDRYIDGFRVQENVAFDAGQQNINIHSRTNPVKDLVVENNYTYHRKTDNTGNFDLGYNTKASLNATVRNNYFVGGTHGYGSALIYNWENLNFTNNTVMAASRYVISHIPHASPDTIVWDNNKYYFGGSSSSLPFKRNSSTYSFTNWKSTTGYDSNSSYTNGYPTGSEALKIFYTTNKYFDGIDPVRGNIVVYNWDKLPTVTADLSKLGLVEGESYEIVDAQHYINTTNLTAPNFAPVKTGKYSATNKTVSLPMNLTEVSNIPGTIDHFENVHTAPEFAVFVVRRASGDTTPVPEPSPSPVPEPSPSPIPVKAQIKLTMAVDKTSVRRKETLTYTVTYKNESTVSATNLRISAPVPVGTTYVSGSATGNGSLSNNSVHWNISSLSAGASGTVSFKTTVD